MEKCRTRLTADSSSNKYLKGSTTAYTADLESIKIMLNMIASNKNLRGSKADIGNFFPVTPLGNGDKEYMALPIKLMPPEAIAKYGLDKLVVNGMVMVENFNAVYGMRQSGKIAGDAVEAHMLKCGWASEPATPCIYVNKAVPNVFVARIVDDFYVTHEKDEEMLNFVDMLKELYETVVYELDCKQFCGLDIEVKNHGTDQKEVHVSIKGYVEEAILELGYTPSAKPQDSPGAWTKPKYGYTEQSETIFDSPLLDAKDKLWVQTAVGKALFYARAVDVSIIFACNNIATLGFNEAAMKATKHMLDYLATHSTATVVYKKSQMLLKCYSDASFDSVPGSRSRYSGIMYFGNKDDSTINGAIHAYSKVFKTIYTSAAAVEYGSLFELGRGAEVIGESCRVFKVEQFCTPLWTDNTTAIKLAKNESKGKRSKTMARQHNWLAQQVKFGRFTVHWESGKTLIADPLTKFVPVLEHRAWAERLLHYPPASSQVETQRMRRVHRARAAAAPSSPPPLTQRGSSRKGVLAR